MNSLDPEKLKIPAYLRKKGITTRARQKLIWTALDRKIAGLSPKSKQPLAPPKALQKPDKYEEQSLVSESSEESQKTLPIFKIVPIGRVRAYYEKIQVAIIHLDTALCKGDLIQLSAGKFLFQQPVESMQINRRDVEKAKKGTDIGLKVAFHAEKDAPVYKVLNFSQRLAKKSKV